MVHSLWPVEPSKTKRTSFEKKRSSGIRVTVIKTGDRSKHCVITATSMEQLMSQATEKLKSTTAIRPGFEIGDISKIFDIFVAKVVGQKRTVHGRS